MGPLHGVKVVDCSEGIAGPMASMYLADFGAEVIKVERPGGDRARTNPGFAIWNRNKSSIVIELIETEGRRQLRSLLSRADLCVFSQPLSELGPLGLDPVSMAESNPACVYLHTPAFASTGPQSQLAESAQLVSALAGVSASQYSFDGSPVDPVIPHVLYGQAIWAATAAVAALKERQRSGHGQTVTVGGIHGWLMTMTGSVTRRPGIVSSHAPGGPGGPVPFYRLYECADGEWLFLAGLTPAFHTAAFAALGVLEELLSDERLGGELLATALPQNSPWVIERVAKAFKAKPRAEWLEILTEAGCPSGPVYRREEWFDHPQVRAMGMRISVEDPSVGTADIPGLPLHLSDTPASVRSAAPSLGSGAIPNWPDPSPASGTATTGPGPLQGVRVLDLGSIIAGTYAGSLLGALGADVVKIESPSGDNLRNFGPTFFGYNLGKRGLVLDLSKREGRDAFLRMVEQADVVVDNYRPGVLKRLGIDYESLSRINPRIISASVTGYGEVGPLGQDPGFDPLLQAASGMMRAQGGADDPVFFLLPVNDVASAATAALGATLALLERERSGRGQRVATSLAAQSIMMQSGEIVRYEGRPEPCTGGRDFKGPSDGDRLYQTADGWIRLHTGVDGLPRVADIVGAAAPNADALSRAFQSYATEEVVERFRGSGIDIAPVRTLDQIVEHPEFVSQGVVQRLQLADGSDMFASGVFAQFSRTPAAAGSRPPGLGEHSRQVLADYGFRDEEIRALLVNGITKEGDPFALP